MTAPCSPAVPAHPDGPASLSPGARDGGPQRPAKPYYADDFVTLLLGDALTVLADLPSGSVDCVVTSPPYYWLRDYGVDGQVGLEASPAEYVEALVKVFSEVRRVLADDGTCWLNLGDSYASEPPGRSEHAMRNSTLHGRDAAAVLRSSVQSAAIDRTKFAPRKNMLGIPWRVAFALQDDGWTLRNAIVWHKPNAMPESVTDRLSGRYEPLFLFSKARRYWFDLDAIREPHEAKSVYQQDVARRRPHAVGKAGAQLVPGQAPQHGMVAGVRELNPKGRNPGDVWAISTNPFTEAHFAVMPVALAERCIAAGCKPGGVVLDPFSGSGTTGLAATKLGRRYVGIDLNPDYLDLSLRTRLAQTGLVDGEGVVSNG